MKQYRYKGNAHPFAVVLCHSKDAEAVRPILDKVKENKLRLYMMDEQRHDVSILAKACSVIVFLTENFYESEPLEDTFVRAGAMNKEIISLKADQSQVPELLSNYLYSKNVINLSKYSAEETAGKILASDALKQPEVTETQKKAMKRWIAVLICAVVLVLAGTLAAILLRAGKEKPEDSKVEETSVPEVLQQYGATIQDVERTASIILEGDKVLLSRFGVEKEEYVGYYWDEETHQAIWYDNETGEEVEYGGPEDLSFVALFPNLQYIILVNQKAEELPDLSGLEKLRSVVIINGEIDTLEGLDNCQALTKVFISGTSISDLSALKTCSSLDSLEIEYCDALTTLDTLASDSLSDLTIRSYTLESLDGMEFCTNLTRNVDLVCLGECPLSDYSSLASCIGLHSVRIDTNRALDVSFAGAMTELQDFEVTCDSIRHLDSIGTSNKVRNFTLQINGETQYLDLDCLSGMTMLDQLYLWNVSCSLDFLENIGQARSLIGRVGIGGRDIDWSGLSYVSQYGMLDLQLSGEDTSLVLESIKDATIGSLSLKNCYNVDLTQLPENITGLCLVNCDVDSLEDLPCRSLTNIELDGLTNLTSFKGLESADKLSRVSVYRCVRLTDWSALQGKTLENLDLGALFVLPDLSQFSFASYTNTRICLNNNPGMEDLSCLDVLPEELVTNGNMEIDVCGDDMINLNALLRFKAFSLNVSSNLTEQAVDLVERGCFEKWETLDWYNPGEERPSVELNSLDDLETLPKAMLKYVTNLTLVGNEVFGEEWQCEIRDDENVLYLILNNWETGEELRRELNPRTLMIAEEGDEETDSFDMNLLSELTGLESLRLIGVSMEDLEGIQNLENLSCVQIICCDITDISALFAVDSIESLRLAGGNIQSIQGIQNLYQLSELYLDGACVEDLSPLKDLPVDLLTEKIAHPDDSENNEEMNEWESSVPGFSFTAPLPWIVSGSPTDFSALAVIPQFHYLDLNSYSQVEWIEYLEGKVIGKAVLFNSLRSNADLERLVSTVDSIEILEICWNEPLTDLRCLIELEGLRQVRVSSNMTEGIASLEGMDLNFELIIED